MEHGGDSNIPAAVVEKGTRVGQRVVTGTIGTLSDQVEIAVLDGPAIVIVGTVVSLRDSLSWYAGSS